MGCSACGKARNSPTAQRAAVQASLDSAKMLGPGVTSQYPVVLGEEIEGENATRVRVMSFEGPELIERSAVWVAGTEVPALIESGDLTLIGATPQAQRIWRLQNGQNYFDFDEASRIANALNLPAPVEIA